MSRENSLSCSARAFAVEEICESFYSVSKCYETPRCTGINCIFLSPASTQFTFTLASISYLAILVK